ncbi:MAG: glycoside hydrolase [Epulopiscium sp. Nele67-Bin005]|nr:MAG: glycoside hydrolase [Epulopiscium sp. Nele67-Bin005]
MKLIFADEFDVDGLPNPDNWGYDVGGHGWGNDELQYYTDCGNAVVRNGCLEIEARIEQKENNKYTSARLVSRNKQDWLYGKIEVRAKLPKGIGTWPAIWLLPTDWEYGGWPDSGEIDIMEHVGYDQNTIHGSVHTLAYFHKINTHKTKTLYIENVSDEFHIYAVDWQPNKVSVSVDGNVYFEYCPTDYVQNPTFAEWPFDKKMHLIINIAVGGGWGGLKGVDDGIFPQKMYIDYVRVYSHED